MRASKAYSACGSCGGMAIVVVVLTPYCGEPPGKFQLFRMRVVLGARGVEGGEGEAGLVDGPDARIRREVDREALRVRHLRDEADVRERGLVAGAKARAGALAQLALEAVEAFAHPMAVPLVAHRLLDAERLREVLEH